MVATNSSTRPESETPTASSSPLHSPLSFPCDSPLITSNMLYLKIYLLLVGSLHNLHDAAGLGRVLTSVNEGLLKRMVPCLDPGNIQGLGKFLWAFHAMAVPGSDSSQIQTSPTRSGLAAIGTPPHVGNMMCASALGSIHGAIVLDVYTGI